MSLIGVEGISHVTLGKKDEAGEEGLLETR